MTIREIIRYEFKCELCGYTDEPRYTLVGALTDEEAHVTIAHPSWVAERERRKLAAEPPTEPMPTVSAATCSVCGEALTNRGGAAWFHKNGLMLCERSGR